ncbi:MAG TPA: hypothetical protein VGJ20_10875 [Xanthobacteraceae bacterium]
MVALFRTSVTASDFEVMPCRAKSRPIGVFVGIAIRKDFASPVWPVNYIPLDALQIFERNAVPQDTGDEEQNSTREAQLG